MSIYHGTRWFVAPYSPLITIASLTTNYATANNKSTSSAQSTGIFPRGKRVAACNFTGNTWVQQLIQPDSAFNIPVGKVTFKAGARTFWHSHSGGQDLLAMDGAGFHQEEGKPIQILRKGDTIKCPPNVPHWHSALPEAGFYADCHHAKSIQRQSELAERRN